MRIITYVFVYVYMTTHSPDLGYALVDEHDGAYTSSASLPCNCFVHVSKLQTLTWFWVCNIVKKKEQYY